MDSAYQQKTWNAFYWSDSLPKQGFLSMHVWVVNLVSLLHPTGLEALTILPTTIISVSVVASKTVGCRFRNAEFLLLEIGETERELTVLVRLERELTGLALKWRGFI